MPFIVLKMNKKVGILGCGWLGIPLAETLQQTGALVSVSRRSTAGVKALKEMGFNAFQINIDSKNPQYTAEFFKGLDILIIAVPPGIRQQPKRRFDLAILHFMEYLKPFNIPRLLFVSSISVYGKLTATTDENTVCHPQTASGQQLLVCEQHLQKRHPNATIFRLGGLVGPKRHPIFSLVQRTEIPKPDAPINLVHLDEVIAYIIQWLEDSKDNACYNVVSPYHPSRLEYYTQCAEALKLPRPKFTQSTENEGIVSSQKIEDHLGKFFNVKRLLIDP